ncbi:MAG: hypothetical protein COB23_06155 [Methylophaga sp.]|nr:MAG: hypothetical protein COB23_06155 [Methylophaga sp.]
MTSVIKIILNKERIPHVDIDFMNNTHFEEIDMVQELGELITEYQQNETSKENEANKITPLLGNWLQHTLAHFDRENSLMLETNFPMYPVHSGEHDNALAEMTRIVTTWELDKDIGMLADYVFNVWPEWFNNHVNSMDMITAQFAVMNGFDPHSLPSK